MLQLEETHSPLQSGRSYLAFLGPFLCPWILERPVFSLCCLEWLAWKYLIWKISLKLEHWITMLRRPGNDSEVSGNINSSISQLLSQGSHHPNIAPLPSLTRGSFPKFSASNISFSSVNVTGFYGWEWTSSPQKSDGVYLPWCPVQFCATLTITFTCRPLCA